MDKLFTFWESPLGLSLEHRQRTRPGLEPGRMERYAILKFEGDQALVTFSLRPQHFCAESADSRAFDNYVSNRGAEGSPEVGSDFKQV